MVFPTLPIYLDPPNWNQPSHQPGTTGGSSGGEARSQLPPPVPPRPEGGMAGGSVIRPGSMADRARMAKLPQPEPALKCPRCDSSNTKFCYFNNYSLSQPRHFCKTCRRYWTRGGALRNVPVGGGCRRNKRSKSGSSSNKSPAVAAADRQVAGTSASGSATSAATGGAIIPSNMLPPPPPQMPFMASLHNLADYGVANIGFSYGAGMQPVDAVDYNQVGINSSSVGLEQWRLHQVQQFPFFEGLEPPPLPPAPSVGMYPFEGEGVVDGVGMYAGQMHGRASTSGLIRQMASVKMEENNPQGLNLPRHYLGINPGNDQYWGGGGGSSGGAGGGWTDLSGFNSPSTGNLL